MFYPLQVLIDFSRVGGREEARVAPLPSSPTPVPPTPTLHLVTHPIIQPIITPIKPSHLP